MVELEDKIKQRILELESQYDELKAEYFAEEDLSYEDDEWHQSRLEIKAACILELKKLL